MYSISEKHFQELLEQAKKHSISSRCNGVYQDIGFYETDGQFTWHYDCFFKFADYEHTTPVHIVIIMTCGVVRNKKFSRLYHLPSPIMKVTH